MGSSPRQGEPQQRLWVRALMIGFGVLVAMAQPADAAQTKTAARAVRGYPNSFAPLVRRIRSGVVNIRVLRKSGASNRPTDPFFDLFRPDEPPESATSLGTGFIISADGDLLTNHHVIEDATRIDVTLDNGKSVEATLVGDDPKTDIALLKIRGWFTPLPLGSSETLQIGDWVIAIGNPFGLEQTVTAGIVSGKGRFINSGPYDDFIQTDASINPGNSGGPLFNMKGQVVGINSAIVAGGNSIGFAIPIDLVKSLLPDLKRVGRVVRGWIGVSIQTVTPDLARSFDQPCLSGVVVNDLDPNGPAKRAGLNRGDIIIRFDRKPTPEARILSRVVARSTIGGDALVEFYRGSRLLQRTVRIERLADPTETSPTANKSAEIGVVISDVTPEAAARLNVAPETGVWVLRVMPGSTADAAGILPSDVILELDDRPVNGVAAFKVEMARKASGTVVRIFIQRGTQSLYIALKKP